MSKTALLSKYIDQRKRFSNNNCVRKYFNYLDIMNKIHSKYLENIYYQLQFSHSVLEA